MSLSGMPNLTSRSATVEFLRIPPFPDAKVTRFRRISSDKPDDAAPPLASLVALLRRHKVGGTYWAEQPSLPKAYYLTDFPRHAALPDTMGEQITWPAKVCDPWHMLSRASALVVSGLDERAAIASALGVPVHVRDPRIGTCHLADEDARATLERLLRETSRANPFDGTPMSLPDIIRLCGFWRSLIDSNRGIAGGLGFAFWKQRNVAVLLWDGGAPFRFAQSPADLPEGKVAIWRSKASRSALDLLRETGRRTVEVEDGFLRSSGLGADCIPPLSIIADSEGIYFNPSPPSDLESILLRGNFDEALVERAKALRSLIVDAGLGKYERSDAVLDRPGGARQHILVPGQVEDDRSVKEGGGAVASNLELLRRVRAAEPEAYILYKPHPDVQAGHRVGHATDQAVREFADVIVRDQPIAPLLAMVDAVHVNTSLSGFEALLRDKPVTTYGAPFYAGWGLTVDRGEVPARRNVKRTLDELVAATLLLYPRYLDPETRLPCPAEVVAQRLSQDRVPDTGMVVRLRRWQGILTRQWRKLAG